MGPAEPRLPAASGARHPASRVRPAGRGERHDDGMRLRIPSARGAFRDPGDRRSGPPRAWRSGCGWSVSTWHLCRHRGRCRRRPGAVRPQWSGSGRGGSGAPPRGRGHLHHTYTNVVGRDRDLGHTILRMSPDQPWHPVHLLQPMYAALLAPVFEWGIALYELPADAVTAARKSVRAFLSDVLDDESRGEWCLRQIQGSANIEGSPDPRTRSFTLVRRDPQAPRVTSELSGCCGPKSTLKRGSHSVSLADRRVSCPTPAPRG